MNDIVFWRGKFPSYSFIFGGDFNVNVNINNNDPTVQCLLKVIGDLNLMSCFDFFPGRKYVTYVDESRGSENLLDYVFVNNVSDVVDTFVFDPDINFSDHLPVVCIIRLRLPVSFSRNDR